MAKQSKLQESIYHLIFEHDTRKSKIFDLALIFCIIASVIVVMLDSVEEIHDDHGVALLRFEWVFTILFTFEYFLRLYSIRNHLYYVRSFYGIVDLLSILPTYLSLILPGTQQLLVIRILRVLRIFRVLKLVQFVGESNLLLRVLRERRNKIIVFLFAIMTVVVILGSLMYLIESTDVRTDNFSSIPKSVYWAIVTMTTVGYGDISPVSPLGQALASIVMIMGYSVIAVPSAFVTIELARAKRRGKGVSHRVCSHCSAEGHDSDAYFCKICGYKLKPEKSQGL